LQDGGLACFTGERATERQNALASKAAHESRAGSGGTDAVGDGKMAWKAEDGKEAECKDHLRKDRLHAIMKFNFWGGR